MAADPRAHLDEWESFYACLRERHELHGIKAFSRDSFADQLAVPGMVMFRDLQSEMAVGAHLWYLHANEQAASSHLAAFSEAGYTLMASYALYYEALRYFAGRVRWLNIGAGTHAGRRQRRADAVQTRLVHR